MRRKHAMTLPVPFLSTTLCSHILPGSLAHPLTSGPIFIFLTLVYLLFSNVLAQPQQQPKHGHLPSFQDDAQGDFAEILRVAGQISQEQWRGKRGRGEDDEEDGPNYFMVWPDGTQLVLVQCLALHRLPPRASSKTSTLLPWFGLGRPVMRCRMGAYL